MKVVTYYLVNSICRDPCFKTLRNGLSSSTSTVLSGAAFLRATAKEKADSSKSRRGDNMPARSRSDFSRAFKTRLSVLTVGLSLTICFLLICDRVIRLGRKTRQALRFLLGTSLISWTCLNLESLPRVQLLRRRARVDHIVEGNRSNDHIVEGNRSISFFPRAGAYWPEQVVRISASRGSSERICFRIRSQNPNQDADFAPLKASLCACQGLSTGGDYFEYEEPFGLITGQFSVEAYLCRQECVSTPVPSTTISRADYQVGIWPTRDYHAFSASSSNQSRAPRIRPRVTPTPTKDLVIAVMYHVQNKDTYVSSRRFWLDRLQSDIRIPCETKNSLASFVVYSYTGIAHIARMYSNMHFVSGEGPLEIATNAFQECFHLYTNASFFIRLESRAFLFPENLAQELCRQNPSKTCFLASSKIAGALSILLLKRAT